MRFDPRTKLITIAALTTVSVLAPNIIYLAATFAFCLIFDLIFKVDFKTAIKRVRHFITMIILISVLQSLTIKGGEVIFAIGKITILSAEGLLRGGEFFLRMSIILFASLIAATSDTGELTDGMIKLKIPYEICFMTSVTLRFLPMFRDEFVNRLAAVSARGIDIKELKIGKKIKLYAYMIAPAVTGSILKSRALGAAMTARAFRAYKTRTMLRELKLTKNDYFIIIPVAVYFIASIALYLVNFISGL